MDGQLLLPRAGQGPTPQPSSWGRQRSRAQGAVSEGLCCNAGRACTHSDRRRQLRQSSLRPQCGWRKSQRRLRSKGRDGRTRSASFMEHTAATCCKMLQDAPTHTLASTWQGRAKSAAHNTSVLPSDAKPHPQTWQAGRLAQLVFWRLRKAVQALEHPPGTSAFMAATYSFRRAGVTSAGAKSYQTTAKQTTD